MKKILILTVSLLLVLTFSISAAEYEDGRYVGYVPDDHGDVVVEVGITNGEIFEVNIVNPVKSENNYEYEEGVEAFREYPAKVLAQQSANIDIVSGATSSYEQYNEALQMALDIASGEEKEKYYGLTKNLAQGHVLLEVTVDGEEVTDVNYITGDGDSDTNALMEAKDEDYPHEEALDFFQTFPEKAVEAANSGEYEVDLISGATHSFHDYNAALRHALVQAGFDV
ncbi:MAG: FMN-binding protein [Halanaerobiales bacterium]